jgi:hypothetical protein
MKATKRSRPGRRRVRKYEAWFPLRRPVSSAGGAGDRGLDHRSAVNWFTDPPMQDGSLGEEGIVAGSPGDRCRTKPEYFMQRGQVMEAGSVRVLSTDRRGYAEGRRVPI